MRAERVGLVRFSELHPCDGCGKGLGATFLRVEISREVVDLAEARKRSGLDVMFPGAPALAATFHGDPSDATKGVHVCQALLCIACGVKLLQVDGIAFAVGRAAAKEGA